MTENLAQWWALANQVQGSELNLQHSTHKNKHKDIEETQQDILLGPISNSSKIQSRYIN